MRANHSGFHIFATKTKGHREHIIVRSSDGVRVTEPMEPGKAERILWWIKCGLIKPKKDGTFKIPSDLQ